MDDDTSNWLIDGFNYYCPVNNTKVYMCLFRRNKKFLLGFIKLQNNIICWGNMLIFSSFIFPINFLGLSVLCQAKKAGKKPRDHLHKSRVLRGYYEQSWLLKNRNVIWFIDLYVGVISMFDTIWHQSIALR